MNLYSIFLSDKEQTKLKIFIGQKEDTRFDLIKFSEGKVFTYRTALNYFKEIKEDLKKINNNLTLSETLLFEKVSIEEYLRFIYLNNFGCQMIYYSLVYPETTMDDFLENSNVSYSKVVKFISKLNKSLSKYNLDFSYKNFCLKGEEQIIQLLFYNVIKGPYFEIDSFFSEEELQNIKDIFKKVFIPENKDSSNIEYKNVLLFLKINLLRLKQNKIFKKTNILPPTYYNLDLLKEWYINNFSMDSSEAEIQAAYVDYFYSFSPYTLNGNDFITIDLLCNIVNIEPKKILAMKEAILNNNLTQSNPYLELRLLSNILFTLIFGISFMYEENFKPLEKNYFEDKEFVLDMYDSLIGKKEIDDKSKQVILKYFQTYKNALTMKFSKVKIYFTSEAFFSGSGLFVNIFQNIAEFYSINSLTLPSKENVMVIYEDDSKLIKKLKQYENIICYKWIFELSYGKNIHRISELLYRTSSSFYTLINT